MRSFALYCLCLALVAAFSTASAVSPQRRVDTGPQRLDSTNTLSLDAKVNIQAIKDSEVHDVAGAGRTLGDIIQARRSSSQTNIGTPSLPTIPAAQSPSGVGTDELIAHEEPRRVSGADERSHTVTREKLEAAVTADPTLRKRCYYIGTFFQRIDCNAPANSTAIPYSLASAPVATQA